MFWKYLLRAILVITRPSASEFERGLYFPLTTPVGRMVGRVLYREYSTGATGGHGAAKIAGSPPALGALEVPDNAPVYGPSIYVTEWQLRLQSSFVGPN